MIRGHGVIVGHVCLGVKEAAIVRSLSRREVLGLGTLGLAAPADEKEPLQ
jgi:hypothetical protein